MVSDTFYARQKLVQCYCFSVLLSIALSCSTNVKLLDFMVSDTFYARQKLVQCYEKEVLIWLSATIKIVAECIFHCF